MFTLSTQSLKPGMIAFEDVYSPANVVLVKSNTALTQEKINLLNEYMIEEIALAEPHEIQMTHYKHLHQHPYFQNFNNVYNESLSAYVRMMKNLFNGIDFNVPKLLSLKDAVMESVRNGEQLLDFLYNLMPNENEITYNHCFNCGLIGNVFGRWAGLDETDLDNLTIACFLFDIGKVKISDDLLWKPGKLTPEEFIQIQHHIHLGYELMRLKKLPPHVISVMIMHHERCDGSGYPAGIKKDRIDSFALIAGIVDTYEAMTHPRAQRLALTPFQAIRIFMQQGSEKYGDKLMPIMQKIAASYVDRKVCMTGNIIGHITEIHEEDPSRPTVFAGTVLYDLRTLPNVEIIRME